MFNGSVQRILDVAPNGAALSFFAYLDLGISLTDLEVQVAIRAIGIHDRCPIIMGCARDVDKVLGRYDEDDVTTAGGESALKKARTE